MAGTLTRTAARAGRKIPGLRRVPILRLLALAEVALLARDHFRRLEPAERRRLSELVVKGRGRKRDLTPEERDELAVIVAKAEPRLFAALAVHKLSPVPLPRRLLVAAARR
jgi:hypothetical protein